MGTYQTASIASGRNLAKYQDDVNAIKKQDQDETVMMIRRIMYDYHANCLKPMFTTRFNERTPFAEYVLPVLKYFGASTGLVSFFWYVYQSRYFYTKIQCSVNRCEIGSKAQKQVVICLSSGQKKLLDGIGFDEHKLERVLVESSGYV